MGIWEGKALHKFWQDLLKREKEKYLECQHCKFPQFKCDDNIDIYIIEGKESNNLT